MYTIRVMTLTSVSPLNPAILAQSLPTLTPLLHLLLDHHTAAPADSLTQIRSATKSEGDTTRMNRRQLEDLVGLCLRQTTGLTIGHAPAGWSH